MEGDLVSTTVEQLSLGSSSEKPHPEVSYISSIIRITRIEGAAGSVQERDETNKYQIELLAPSAGQSALCSPALQSFLMS